MTWRVQVMREAKTLGIPLRQPGTGPARAAERRSSISQLADGPDVWSCSRCHRTVVEPSSSTPATAPVLPRNASPFRDVLRIFGRKVKDDSRSKAKQALTLPRGLGACERCSGRPAPEVTSSPCSRRHAEAGPGAGPGPSERVKYRRSASTPRPAGDAGRLQLLQPATEHRPAGHTHAAGTRLRDSNKWSK